MIPNVRRSLRLCLALLALLPASGGAQPQSSAVRGHVAGIEATATAPATVTLLDQLGTPVATAAVDDTGRFRLDDVPPGTYVVLAEAPPRRSGARVVTIDGATPVEVDLVLATGLSESVVVHGRRELTSATTRVTIAGDALRHMPTRLASRGLQQMLATLPGWASEDNGLLHVRGVDDGILYVEDGVPVYDRIDSLFGIAPDPSDVGTINVFTGYVPPVFGLKSGAVVEVQSSGAARPSWSGTVDGGIGGDALRSLRANAGGPSGGRTRVMVSGAGERSARFLDPVDPDNVHNTGGQVSGGAHLTAIASDADLVKVNVSAGRSRFDVPHGLEQDEAGQDQRQRLQQHAQSVSWQRAWSTAVVSNVAVHHRRLASTLAASPHDTPLTASADRRHARIGGVAGVSWTRGRHAFRAGGEVAHVDVDEDFRFAVTDPEAAGEAEISEAAIAFTPAHPFVFADRVSRGQWSFYVQDSVRAGDRLTIDFGVRFDRTHLLVSASQWSPRVGVAYALPRTSTTVRASLNRFFQPPQPEFLLLASSPEARALSPFADADEADGGGAAVAPERQTAWDVGVEQWLGGIVRLDAAYWSRHVRNYADPNVFFGTTIVFPNSVASGTARGVDLRMELARLRGWSAYGSYTWSRVEQVGPITGGLFLEDTFLEIGPGTRFTPDHDQRHVAAAGATYHHPGRGLSVAAAFRYQSGTPLEVGDDDRDELAARPGADLVDVEAGRVKPHAVVDLSVSKSVHRGRRSESAIRVTVVNAFNRAYALNFGNPFSGTHFGAPRTVRLGVEVGFR